MNDAPTVLERGDDPGQRGLSGVADAVEEALFEEAKGLRRRRWRYGAAAFAAVVALGTGLGLTAYSGGPTRPGSGATVPTHVPNLLGSPLAASSREPGRVPKLRFSTQAAGLAGQTIAKESSVSCSFVVPAVPVSAYLYSRLSQPEAVSLWMGTAGGPTQGNFIQVGVDVTTERQTTEGLTVLYQAFWAQTGSSHPVAHAVAPGDELHASISEGSPGTDWVVTIADVTQGWRFRQTVSYHGRERTPLWSEAAPILNHMTPGTTRVEPFVPLKPVSFKRMRINGRPLEPGRSTYVEMVNTTTGEAGVPRYTRRSDSLTITQTSADSVLRHNPL